MATQFGQYSSINDVMTKTAILHLQKLQLSEPLNGALSYAFEIAENPGVDQRLCEVAGKIVHITAKCSQKIEGKIGLRGDSFGLSWYVDYESDNADPMNFFERSFTFYVPKANINQIFEFKLVNQVENKLRWLPGGNTRVDLSKFGHIVSLKLNGVSFS